MLCDSVGITPKPNNGTLRLPLKPIGIHADEDNVEEPQDPVPTNAPQRPTPAASHSDQNAAAPTQVAENPATPPSSEPEGSGSDEGNGNGGSKVKGLFDFLKDSAKDAWRWVKEGAHRILGTPAPDR